MNFAIKDIPCEGAPTNDPCHFRIEVHGGTATLVHDFLIDAVLAATRDELCKLGERLQEVLRGIQWGNEPAATLERDLLSRLRSLRVPSDSQIVVRDDAPHMGATYTSIGIGDRSLYHALMTQFSG